MLLITYPLISSYTHNGDDTLQKNNHTDFKLRCNIMNRTKQPVLLQTSVVPTKQYDTMERAKDLTGVTEYLLLKVRCHIS